MMTQLEVDFMRVVPSRMNELNKRQEGIEVELEKMNQNLEQIAQLLGEMINQLKMIG